MDNKIKYSAPTAEIIDLTENDIITTSIGDTPFIGDDDLFVE